MSRLSQLFAPKEREFFDLFEEAGSNCVRAYAEEVRNREFPGPQHSYGIAPEELERLRAVVGGRRRSTA